MLPKTHVVIAFGEDVMGQRGVQRRFISVPFLNKIVTYMYDTLWKPHRTKYSN